MNRRRSPRRLPPVLLALGLAACGDGTGVASLAIPGPPDFAAVATENTYHEFFAPSGSWVRQYEVWVAIPPSDSANAGVVVAAACPVYSSVNGAVARVTPAAITPGDTIQVWRDATTAWGSVQAPPGAPAYHGLQVVIVHHMP